MAIAREGTQVILWVYEWGADWPEPGDFLRTESGSCYRIEKVRPARFGSATLGSFVCTRLMKDAVQDGDPGVFRWHFATRVRTVLPSAGKRRKGGR